MNNYIINKSVRNDYIKEKERSSYRYGMDVLILNLIPIFIILVILVVTRNIEFAILFLLFFIPILFIKFNKLVRYLNFLPVPDDTLSLHHFSMHCIEYFLPQQLRFDQEIALLNS